MFASRFGKLLKSVKRRSKTEKNRKDDEEEEPSSPYVTWIMNAIRGLPTDEDIRKTYFWECRKLRAHEMCTQAESKRSARLQRLWRAQWYSSVHILRSASALGKKGGIAGAGTTGDQQKKSTAFAMILGHRFLWWRSVADFDGGEPPSGRIFLAGHAGLATPSPIEMRSIDKADVPRLTCIFGRGMDGQEKITVIAPSADVKEQLELAVSFATSAKKD